MKAAIFRVFVFLISFGIGMTAAHVAGRIRSWTLGNNPGAELIEYAFKRSPEPNWVSENGSIEITANTEVASQWKMIEFTVINHNIIPATYWSFSGSDIHPALKHNGKDVFVYFCGSGQKRYTIAPGRSLTFTVPESFFTTNPGTREGKFRAGFSISFIEGNHVYYWSDDFELKKH